jgi:hypothetical protein
MPGTHESCNKIRLSHTSALGGLFIADEWEGMQGKVYEVDSGSQRASNSCCFEVVGVANLSVDFQILRIFYCPSRFEVTLEGLPQFNLLGIS